ERVDADGPHTVFVRSHGAFQLFVDVDSDLSTWLRLARDGLRRDAEDLFVSWAHDGNGRCDRVDFHGDLRRRRVSNAVREDCLNLTLAFLQSLGRSVGPVSVLIGFWSRYKHAVDEDLDGCPSFCGTADFRSRRVQDLGISWR